MRFRQATDQLQSPSWTRMVAVSSGREPGPAHRAVPHGAKVAPPHGPSRHGTQLQARSHARSAIYSQDMRRSGRDTCNDARTAAPRESRRPRHWTRATPSCALRPTNASMATICRIAARSCTLTSPRLSGRSVIRVVADDLPRFTLSHRQWVAEDKNFYANTRLFRRARARKTAQTANI